MFTIDEILKATGGRLILDKGKGDIKGISTDSRTIKEGDLFIALTGDRFDGHKFVGQAIQKGATGAIVQRSRVKGQGSRDRGYIIEVGDTLRALQEIARFHRERHPIPLVAITGSNGKTTTKEMIAQILGLSSNVLKNEGNLNNHIGVPLSLLRLDSRHEVVVMEMGMSNKGEIKRLCEIAHPGIGIITNIGHAHLQTLKTIEAVADAKGELLEGLDKDAVAILNRDDEMYARLRGKVRSRFITFGLPGVADFRAEDIRVERGGSFLFTIRSKGDGAVEIRLPLYGRHNIYNALAAAAACSVLNIHLGDIKKGLETYRTIHGRMEVKVHRGRFRIIDDTYNANPDSVEAALRTAVDMRGQGRVIAAFGDMLELGEYSSEAHQRIGCLAHELGVDYIFALGELAPLIIDGARSKGMPEDRLFVYKDHNDLAKKAREILKEGDILLVKGSRRMGMEKIVEALR